MLAAGDPSDSIEPVILFDEREANYITTPQTMALRSAADGNNEHRDKTFLQRIISSVRESTMQNVAAAASASKSLIRSARKAGRRIWKSKQTKSPAEIVCAIETIRNYLAQAEAIDPNAMALAVAACK